MTVMLCHRRSSWDFWGGGCWLWTFKCVSDALPVPSFWGCDNAAKICHLWLILWSICDVLIAAGQQMMTVHCCQCCYIRSCGTSVCTPFSYQILVDDVESCPTKACFTLYLIKVYACIFLIDIGYCFHCGYCMQCCQMLGLNPFCPEALPLLKLHTQLNTVMCVGAFPPQIAANQSRQPFCLIGCLLWTRSPHCCVHWQVSSSAGIMKTKINEQNAQTNSGLIYYWSITPTCFGPSVEAISREFNILESYKAIVLI